MDLSKLEFFGVAVTSGLVAGVANQLAKFGHDWLARRGASKQKAKELEHQTTTQTRQLEHQQAMQSRDLEHQRKLQMEEREHQASVRREVSFFEARKDLLPLAVDVLDWIHWQHGREYGGEVDSMYSSRSMKLACRCFASLLVQRWGLRCGSRSLADKRQGCSRLGVAATAHIVTRVCLTWAALGGSARGGMNHALIPAAASKLRIRRLGWTASRRRSTKGMRPRNVIPLYAGR